MNCKMYQKLIIFLIIVTLTTSCIGKKKDEVLKPPLPIESSFLIYEEALEEFYDGQLFLAAKKFEEAETVLPKVEDAAKALLMSSYCYFTMNFLDEAEINLKRFLNKYPADKNISYGKYLLVITFYERILDEKKDISPLLDTKNLIDNYLEEFPNNEYSLDLSFKKDLILNQLAAKELHVAKYYIKTQKWIPAINRLKVIVNDYNETIFIEEALHRLVEVYYNVGLVSEAKSAAAILGYNYNSSKWYEQSYKILNKKYKIPEIRKAKKEDGLINRAIKKILRKKN